MSQKYIDDLYKLLESDDESKKLDALSKLMKIARKGVILNPKQLVYCLLYSKEAIVECKVLSLLSVLSIQHVSFKQIVSNMSVIYNYAMTGLSSGCSNKIPRVLRLLTALSYRLVREDSSRSLPDGSSSSDQSSDDSHLVAKEEIRHSGCLNQMCLLFVRIDNKNPVWPLLCDCLIECCSDHPANQDHSSHILPKCLREMNQPKDKVKVEMINIVIALTKSNTQNCEKFLQLGGMECIYKNLLQSSEGIELLYVLLESCKLASQQAAQYNILEQLNSRINTNSRYNQHAVKDLKLLHWITRTVLKFGNSDHTIKGQLTEDVRLKDKKQPIKMREKLFDNNNLIAPIKRSHPHYNSKRNGDFMNINNNKENMNFNGKVNKKKRVDDKRQLTESFRSKYDAISTVDTTLNNTLRNSNETIISICKNSSNVIANGKPKLNDNLQLDVNFKNVSANFSQTFTPKHSSTPHKKSNNFKKTFFIRQDRNPVQKLQIKPKEFNKNELVKFKDAFNKPLVINCSKNDGKFNVDNDRTTSSKVRQLVKQVESHYENNVKNYVLRVNGDDLVPKKNNVNAVMVQNKNLGINLESLAFKNNGIHLDNGAVNDAENGKVEEVHSVDSIAEDGDVTIRKNLEKLCKDGSQFNIEVMDEVFGDHQDEIDPMLKPVDDVIVDCVAVSGDQDIILNDNVLDYVECNKENDKMESVEVLEDQIDVEKVGEENVIAANKEIEMVDDNKKEEMIFNFGSVFKHTLKTVPDKDTNTKFYLFFNEATQNKDKNSNFNLFFNEKTQNDGTNNINFCLPLSVTSKEKGEFVKLNDVIDNINRKNDVIDNINKKNDVIDNVNKKDDVVDNINKNNEVIDNINMKNDIIDNINKKDDVIDSINKKYDVIDNINKKNDVIDNMNKQNDLIDDFNKKNDVTDNVNNKNDVIDNINKKNDVIDSINKKDDVTDNINKKEDVTDNINKKNGDIDNINKKNDVIDNINNKNDVIDNIKKINDVIDNINKKDDVIDNINKKNDVIDNINKNNEVIDNINKKNDVIDNIIKKDDVIDDINKKNDVIDNINKKNDVTDNVEIDKEDTQLIVTNNNLEKTISEETIEDDLGNDLSPTNNKTCCKARCKELDKLLRRLKKGISLHGLNFQKISKDLWPKDASITAKYLYKVFRAYIVRK